MGGGWFAVLEADVGFLFGGEVGAVVIGEAVWGAFVGGYFVGGDFGADGDGFVWEGGKVGEGWGRGGVEGREYFIGI